MTLEKASEQRKGGFMKSGISRFVVVAAIAALVVVGGSKIAWAQGCPTSPNYVNNFNSDQTCLSTNINAAFFPSEGTPTVLRITSAVGNQRGSAWFKTPQSVQNGFSTTFQFRFTNPSSLPADGIAFVIQNAPAGLAAIGSPPNGGALGYGDADANPDPSTGAGIPKSLAVEFDSYHNGWDPGDVTSASHVAVQSCGNGPNTSHHGEACGGDGPANSTLGVPVPVSNLAAGSGVHSVTITYAPACSTCQPQTPANLHVILDNADLYAGGVPVDLSSIGLGDGGTAYVGFTGATGGNFENQDVLNWTLTPVSQSGVVSQGQTTVIPFQNDAYNYTAQLNNGSPTPVTVTPILQDPSACDLLLQPNFPGAHCFVYQNAAGSGSDKAVMFELTCPQLPNSPECNPFDAQLGTQFDLSANNPGFDPSNPFPGWLKGRGPDTAHPCAQNPGNSPALFQSNQIDSFLITRIDPFTKGGSGGTGSCWVATYNQPDEARPGITIISPTNGAFYAQNQIVPASYSCNNPSTSTPNLPENTSHPTGPYLTAASCTQKTDNTLNTNSCATTSGGLSCTGSVDTSAVGLHKFLVTALDSGGNPNTKEVPYNVVGATDLSIFKVAPSKIATGSKLTYGIVVADLGSASAVGVNVTDPLPAGTTFVSASGSNLSCSIVNRRLVCSTTAITCTGGTTTPVNCSVGTLAPLAWSSLNGAVIQITVKVTAAGGTTIKNTATVSGTNTDTKPGNNSSSASTLVTAH